MSKDKHKQGVLRRECGEEGYEIERQREGILYVWGCGVSRLIVGGIRASSNLCPEYCITSYSQ